MERDICIKILAIGEPEDIDDLEEGLNDFNSEPAIYIDWEAISRNWTEIKYTVKQIGPAYIKLTKK